MNKLRILIVADEEWNDYIYGNGRTIETEYIMTSLKSKVVYDDGHIPGKPNPTVFNMAIEKLGVKPEDCIIFEDSAAGVEAAYKAGVSAVYLINSEGITNTKVDGVFKDYYEYMNKEC